MVLLVSIGLQGISELKSQNKIDPSNIEEARAFYNGEEISGVIRKQKGYQFNYLLESIDNPGDAISISAWDSQADGEAYEQSGTYARLAWGNSSGGLLLPLNSSHTRSTSRHLGHCGLPGHPSNYNFLRGNGEGRTELTLI